MCDSRWEKVKEVFQAALERSSGAERERYLSEVCGSDADFRREVLDLLDSFDAADDFLDESPISEVAEAIVGKTENLAAGQQIGRYRIERKLGAGGMGEVYLAHDIELERFVALKILSAAFSNNADRVRRFLQEARAASALNHPNILTIYEIGQSENLRFIVTEYIEGETLRERQRGGEPLALHEILDVFGQTAAALNAAHDAGIVHRDIKPENIMLRLDGLVKVLDFGLAKLVENETAKANSENSKKAQVDTTPGLVMGTVAYMSPEQARGLPTDARTDVWSLGVCLSEIAFGVQPFAGETVSDQIAAILKSEPIFGSQTASPGLRRIVEKCLEKTVEDRYQTIKDFSLDLKSFGKELKFSAEPGLSFAYSSGQKNVGANERSNGKQTDGRVPFSTQNSLPPRSSSAEYVVGEIKKRKFLSASAAGVAVAVMALVLYFSGFSEFSHAKPINSLAVMSFVNESGDADGEYLSDGLSESLINKLSELPQLKVAARGSAFKYKGKDIDLPEVARALNVEAIVTGRVARRGDDLQIAVELIDAADNTQIWGESYRRKASDAQMIQEEIAGTITQKLRLKLSGEQQKRINAPLTASSQAYQLYLNGVFYRRKNGDDNIGKAIELQRQAIALDPNFALAHVELALNQYNLVAIGTVDSQVGLPPVREAVEKALTLDPNLAEAHDLNASLKAAEFDWTGAAEEFQRALEANPNLAAAHTAYADYLSDMGHFDEALREIRRAQEIDPLRAGLFINEAEILHNARRYDQAIAVLERDNLEMKVQPYPLIYLARAYTAKNRFADAIAALRKSFEIGETPTALIHLGRAHALAGERDEALAVLERLNKTAKYVSPAESAILYAALGMREKAFVTLEQALAARDLQLAALKTAPEYDILRDDARFDDLLRRINLSQ